MSGATTDPSGQLRYVLARYLASAGFDSATDGALLGLETLFSQYMESVLDDAKVWGESARRNQPSPRDVLRALCGLGVEAEGLKTLLAGPAPRRIGRVGGRPRRRKEEDGGNSVDGFREVLPSLPANTPPVLPSRRHIPAYLPPFPPIHTFKRTPSTTAPPKTVLWAQEECARDGRLAEDAIQRMKAKQSGRLHEFMAEWQGLTEEDDSPMVKDESGLVEDTILREAGRAVAEVPPKTEAPSMAKIPPKTPSPPAVKMTLTLKM